MSTKNNPRLKIAVVIDIYDTAKTGGILTAKRFVDRIRKHHDVTVISSGNPAEGKVVVPSFYVPFVKHLMEKNQFIFASPKKSIIEKALKGIDIVHLQLPFFLEFKTRKIARKMGLPIVAGFHVQPENITYNLGLKKERYKKLLYSFFIKRFYNKMDAIICPSRFAESELKTHGLTIPTYVISNGLLPQYKPMKLRKYKEYSNKFVILSVGRLAKDKRHEILIQAIASSKYETSIQLVITGKGPQREKLEEMGEQLTNKPFFGFVTEEELIRFYNTADLYVHPSDVELESMSVLEAIGCGLPALISDSKSSASKQFALNDDFLFKSGDPVDLSRKIDYWIENKKALKGAKAKYRKIAEHFQINKSIHTIETVYSEIIKNYKCKK